MGLVGMSSVAGAGLVAYLAFAWINHSPSGERPPPPPSTHIRPNLAGPAATFLRNSLQVQISLFV